MDDEQRAPASGARSRARPEKPTHAERRERRAQVDDPAEVLDAAARFLEARQRSVAEVRRKLLRLGYRPELVEDVVVRLEDLRYLDDEVFARAWVESRDRARPRGEHALRQELALKGVDRALVDAVLGERRDEAREAAAAMDDEPVGADEAAAERLLRKRLASILREGDPRRRRQKAYALLARSGFSPDVCGSVSRRVLEDRAAEDDRDGDAPD